MRHEKAENLLRLICAMQESAQGVGLDDIMEMFDVSRRTAERMRDAALRAYPQIDEFVDDERRKRWRMPRVLSKQLLTATPEELADLSITAELVRAENRPQLADSLELVAAKLRAQLRPEQLRRLDPDIEALLEAEGVAMRPGPRPVVRDSALAAIREAIMGAEVLIIDYVPRSGRPPMTLEVHPYGILHGARHYLVARTGSRRPRFRLFALPNIMAARLAGRGFERLVDFDLSAYAQGSFGVFQEEPFDVCWLFSPDAAADARNFLFHPSQRLEDLPDGRLRVRFQAGGWLEMCWHLFTWHGKVAIEEPEWLRDRFVELCGAAAAAAGGVGVPVEPAGTW